MTLTMSPVLDPAPAGARRALLIDDHQLLTQSLAVALEMEGVPCTVAALRDRDTLLREVVALSPDIVLLDLDLGGDLGDGSLLVTPLIRAGCRVLVVSASTDHDQICRALERGAVGVLDKVAPFKELLATVLAAARGNEVMVPAQRRRMLEQARARHVRHAQELAPFERLSVRETQVLRALAEGLSVVCIAEDRFVSEATVRTQVRAILTKLGVASQLQAVAEAHRCGWLERAAAADEAGPRDGLHT